MNDYLNGYILHLKSEILHLIELVSLRANEAISHKNTLETDSLLHMEFTDDFQPKSLKCNNKTGHFP